MSAEIRERLADAIRTGQLAPGTPLPAERVLCQEFGVARTSVREAIQGLVIAGYLERRGNRSVVAEHLPEVNFAGDDRKALVTQLFEVRQVIEPAIVEMATRRATDDRARRDRRHRRAQHPTTSTSSATSTASSTRRSPVACGNPLLNEVHAKALASLFGSGEFASLLYAEVNRAEVLEIIDTLDRGAPGDRRRDRRRATRARPWPPWSPTSTTSNGAWWSGCCERELHDEPERDQYCYFFDDELFEETDRPGFRRRVIIGEHLQLWFWRIKGGADRIVPAQPRRQRTARHHHARRARLPHRRAGGPGPARCCSAGDIYLAPTSVWHGDSIFIGDDEYDEVWILDVFAPPRTGSGLPTNADGR